MVSALLMCGCGFVEVRSQFFLGLSVRTQIVARRIWREIFKQCFTQRLPSSPCCMLVYAARNVARCHAKRCRRRDKYLALIFYFFDSKFVWSPAAVCTNATKNYRFRKKRKVWKIMIYPKGKKGIRFQFHHIKIGKHSTYFGPSNVGFGGDDKSNCYVEFNKK